MSLLSQVTHLYRSSPGPALCDPRGLQPLRLLCPWGYSRQEHWGGLPCPPPGDLPDPGIDPLSVASPALAGGFFTSAPPGETLGCLKVAIQKKKKTCPTYQWLGHFKRMGHTSSWVQTYQWLGHFKRMGHTSSWVQTYQWLGHFKRMGHTSSRVCSPDCVQTLRKHPWGPHLCLMLKLRVPGLHVARTNKERLPPVTCFLTSQTDGTSVPVRCEGTVMMWLYL